MYKQFIIVAIISGIALLPFIIDNTDTDPWREGPLYIVAGDGSVKTISRFSQDWQPQENYDEYHERLAQQKDQEIKESLKQTFAATKDVCTNGYDHTALSYTQYVNEFIKGPCAPIITVPGLIGTQLQVMIDCEKLQSQSPEVFANCGWQTCNSAQFWLKKPSAEYRLWIGLTTSPLSILQTSKKDKCFGDFIELKYDATKPNPRDRYTSAPGITVTWAGNTPETTSESECGSVAIQEVAKDPIIKAALCDQKGYRTINDMLKNMGYIPGLTMQAAPYDFRLSIAASETQPYIKRSLSNIFKITGKKTWIAGHSLGSLHSTNALYELTQAEKDKMVAGVIAIGGPLLGATKTFKPQFGGDDSFLINFLLFDGGINYYSQTKMAHTASSIVDLYPKDTFIRFRNEPWMVELLQRMEADAEFLRSGKFPTSNVPLPWFPTPNSKCGADFTDRPNNCLLLMSDLKDHFLKVEGKTYDAQEASLKAAISENIEAGAAKTLLSFVDETKRPKAINVEHPGVPVVILYGAHTKGPYQLTYNNNPKTVVTETQDFYFPEEISTTVGDGTVVASSAMAPGVKWVWEHQNGKVPHPTKMVEYCSEWSGDKSSIYDTTDYSKPRKIRDSGYVGLRCQCRNGEKKMDNCSHACMINDPILVEFLADVLLNNQPSAISSTTYTEDQLKTIVTTCDNLKL